MKVKELIAALQAFPEDTQDLEIYYLEPSGEEHNCFLLQEVEAEDFVPKFGEDFPKPRRVLL